MFVSILASLSVSHTLLMAQSQAADFQSSNICSFSMSPQWVLPTCGHREKLLFWGRFGVFVTQNLNSACPECTAHSHFMCHLGTTQPQQVWEVLLALSVVMAG